jgi:hypothetical protein
MVLGAVPVCYKTQNLLTPNPFFVLNPTTGTLSEGKFHFVQEAASNGKIYEDKNILLSRSSNRTREMFLVIWQQQMEAPG